MTFAGLIPSKPRVKSSDIEDHFPTRVMSRQFSGSEELNSALEKLMLKLEGEVRNVSSETSTIGGFQTGNELLSRSEPEIVLLREMIENALEEYLPKLFRAEGATIPQGLKRRLWGWGVSMREGDINTQHVHPNAKVSGVYYVAMPAAATGKPKNPLKPEGAFLFADPRPRADMNRLPNQATSYTIPPKPGQMIMFPSYYEHSVLPFRGPGVRTCVAFNLAF